MPKDDHVYKQMPEEVCDLETYEALLAAIPKDVNWDDLVDYEDDDNTLGSQELACSGGACEIVDLVSGV
jgi:ribonucleoside-diphosphate reductase alpha chain